MRRGGQVESRLKPSGNRWVAAIVEHIQVVRWRAPLRIRGAESLDPKCERRAMTIFVPRQHRRRHRRQRQPQARAMPAQMAVHSHRLDARCVRGAGANGYGRAQEASATHQHNATMMPPLVSNEPDTTDATAAALTPMPSAPSEGTAPLEDSEAQPAAVAAPKEACPKGRSSPQARATSTTAPPARRLQREGGRRRHRRLRRQRSRARGATGGGGAQQQWLHHPDSVEPSLEEAV